MTQALVIGGGPAGLMAADALLSAGHRVLLAESMPTLGRKFLMAGKSGLNLTRAQPFGPFLAAYGPASAELRPTSRPTRCRPGPKGWARPPSPARPAGCFPRS